MIFLPIAHRMALRHNIAVMSVLGAAFLALLVMLAPALHAQDFPKLTGRVVDAANLLDPAQEIALDTKLEQLEKQSQRQLVVVTIADLKGYDIADYGFRLGDHWGIGNKDRDDGALLIVAPKERKVRIEVGYGLEGVLTDALSSRIIRNNIIPHFRENDFPAGINAGADAIVKLLLLPPDEARAIAQKAEQEQKSSSGNGEFIFFIIIFMLFFVIPTISSLFFGRKGGRAYRKSGMPVVLWGPGIGSGWGSGSSRGGGFGGGGFGGGGGGFGGGGASGGW